jgi:hypothetical protein
MSVLGDFRAARRSACAAAAAATLALAPGANADFLGLETGDLIDTMGYTITPPGGSFVDSADTLDIDAFATDITTTSPEVLTEINGGDIEVNLDLSGETLTFLGTAGPSFVYSYVAQFTGRAGVDDIVLQSPTGGPNPEQDGRDLVIGEIISVATVSVAFDTLGLLGPPTLTIGGTFSVTGGDATFLQAFGNVGSLADIVGISSSSTPSLAVLLADGFLFSSRTTDLTGTGCGGQAPNTTCNGTVINQNGSFTFGGNGEIQPQNAAPFVPEPTTFSLVAFGLIAGAAAGRRR